MLQKMKRDDKNKYNFYDLLSELQFLKLLLKLT